MLQIRFRSREGVSLFFVFVWRLHFFWEYFHCFSDLKPIAYVIIPTSRARSCGKNSFIPILMLCSEQILHNNKKIVPISILWYFGMWIHASLGIVVINSIVMRESIFGMVSMNHIIHVDLF